MVMKFVTAYERVAASQEPELEGAAEPCRRPADEDRVGRTPRPLVADVGVRHDESIGRGNGTGAVAGCAQFERPWNDDRCGRARLRGRSEREEIAACIGAQSGRGAGTLNRCAIRSGGTTRESRHRK